MTRQDKFPEQVERFIYHGAETEIGRLLVAKCLEPALTEVGAAIASHPDDIELGHGLGGETVRYTYWQGTQEANGAPPLEINEARELVLSHVNDSLAKPEREHLRLGLMNAAMSAYSKGYKKEFGIISLGSA